MISGYDDTRTADMRACLVSRNTTAPSRASASVCGMLSAAPRLSRERALRPSASRCPGVPGLQPGSYERPADLPVSAEGGAGLLARQWRAPRPVARPGLLGWLAQDVVTQDRMPERLIDRGLAQPGPGRKPRSLFLQFGQMVDHEGHDLVRLTLADAGDARLLACCALPERMPGRALTSQVPGLAASPQRLGKPRVGRQRRLGQRAIGSHAFRLLQDRRRLLPVMLG